MIHNVDQIDPRKDTTSSETRRAIIDRRLDFQINIRKEIKIIITIVSLCPKLRGMAFLELTPKGMESTTSLSQMERDLSIHSLVKEVVVVQHDTTMKAFVTLSNTAGSGSDSNILIDDRAEAQQVKLWRTVFDKGMYATIKNKPGAIGRDFTGWVCQYNGKPLDIGEMNEWLDDTIDKILTSHGINHSLDILELGTGSGMILFNLTKNLRSYHGLDPSPNAVDFVGATALTIPELDGKLHLYLGTALDLHLLGTVAPTLAIINSVVQYFPSSSYLLKVIQGLLGLKGIRTIFIGDVRSYALEEEFSFSRALDKLGAKASKAGVRKEMAQAHSELLVDPAFFTSLVDRFPGLVEHVEILPKHMKASNELVQYRYAAVIHVVRDNAKHATASRLDLHNWIDFTKHELNREHLLCRLKASTEDIMAVSNIPYSKTIFERHVIDALEEAQTTAEESPDWLSMARSKSEALPSLSAKDLDIIAEQAGYQVQISCARQHSQRGGLDAIFYRGDHAGNGFKLPTDHTGREFHTLANQPLGRASKPSGNPQQELRDALEGLSAS